MNAASGDRRVRRTRALLHEALRTLIVERGYDRITVQDIIDRADVGRSTFYAHFRDKDDLFLDGFNDVRAELIAALDEVSRTDADILQALVVIFRHVEGERHLWRPLARHGGAELGIRVLRETLQDVLRPRLRARAGGGTDPVRLDAAVQFVTSAMIGLLTWWLNDDVPFSADEIHATYRRLVGPGLTRYLTAPGPRTQGQAG